VNRIWPRLELRTRLIVAYMSILLSALVVTWLVTTFAGPALFRNRLEGSTPLPAETLRRAEDAFRAANAIQVLIATGIVVLLVITVSTVASRSILASLSRFVSAAASVAAGDYSVRVPERLAGRELDTVAAAFNEMAERVEKVEATRRRMLADLAHEMATPLANLDGYLEGVQDGVVELNAALIGVLRGQIARLTRLTDDIHAVSAADEGRLGLDIAPIRVAAVVHEATDALRPAFTDKHVRLQVHAEPTALIDADHERLVQVLTNLLNNALRHTPPGGDVDIRTEAHREGVDIVVHDTGEGIAAEHLPHLFERFYRAHPNSGHTAGSGIGLTISKAIVTGHHGQITVHSAGVGHGTEVQITLPRAG
jgi:two-component system, OmpR family, sensor histidine kinase BaeS